MLKLQFPLCWILSWAILLIRPPQNKLPKLASSLYPMSYIPQLRTWYNNNIIDPKSAIESMSKLPLSSNLTFFILGSLFLHFYWLIYYRQNLNNMLHTRCLSRCCMTSIKFCVIFFSLYVQDFYAEFMVCGFWLYDILQFLFYPYYISSVKTFHLSNQTLPSKDPSINRLHPFYDNDPNILLLFKSL